MTTTIKIKEETKARLDEFREYKNESYDEVIRKILYISDNVEKNTKLSKEVIKKIEEARERVRKGHYVTFEEAKKRLRL